MHIIVEDMSPLAKVDGEDDLVEPVLLVAVLVRCLSAVA
jgi:hypothetical protein